MFTDKELEGDSNENELAYTLAVLFLALVLLTICIVSAMLLSQRIVSRQTPTQVVPLVYLPTELPMAMPVRNNSLLYFPIVLNETVSVPVTVPEQIWIVTKINYLGYELNGQRYDLATFQRINSQDTSEAYCINRGWDTPDIGTEYLLNAEGIFIPSNEADANPIQRFQKIP